MHRHPPRLRAARQVQACAMRWPSAGPEVLGLPGDERAMGALASLDQREEVRARIRDLQPRPRSSRRPRRSPPASGDADARRLPEPGAAVLRPARPPRAVHDVEAFGPVSTLMPYDDLDEAVALAHRGKGSLVASVFTDDPGVAEALVISAWRRSMAAS
jgi:oxepin-CoA hydrolase / 3-oxo-5,6-dehydrosuberyl-CoA semialdehyde dehydrogenase